MIRKLWVKFDEAMDIECVCDEHHKKCTKETDCKEYIVKFTEIDRTDEKLKEAVDSFAKVTSKFQSEVSKSIRKFKI